MSDNEKPQSVICEEELNDVSSEDDECQSLKELVTKIIQNANKSDNPKHKSSDKETKHATK